MSTYEQRSIPGISGLEIRFTHFSAAFSSSFAHQANTEIENASAISNTVSHR